MRPPVHPGGRFTFEVLLHLSDRIQAFETIAD